MIVPVLPFALSPYVLILNCSPDNTLAERIAPGDLVSPAILAPATRAVYDLIASGDRPVYKKINNVLGSGSGWQRTGIYLVRSGAAGEDYSEIWKKFLEQGFLLPPSAEEPLILPGIMSAGEEAKLAELLNAF